MPSTSTTINLDSHHAARALRTTQKATPILGETPYLLENELPIALASFTQQVPAQKPTPKALRRHGSIFTHNASPSLATHGSSSSSVSLLSSASSSTDSLLATPPGLGPQSQASRKPRGARPPLLKLNTATPPSPTDASARFNFASFLPLSPPRAQSQSQSRPSTTPSSPVYPLTPRTALPSPTALLDPEVIRQKRMIKLSRTLGENIPFELVFPPPRSSAEEPSAPTATKPSKRRRSNTVDFGRAAPKSPAPFDPYFQPAPEGVPAVPALPAKARREQDWVGEWNRPDIRDVQKALRHLKL